MLGPLEVRRDGRLLAVPGGKTSELLVRLALDAGELVRTDRLLDDLWAAGGVTTRRNTLQSKVAKLRRALGDPPVIVSGDGGYALDVEPSDVDALAVLAQTAAAAAARRRRRRPGRRRPVRVDVDVVPWGGAPRGRRRRLGRSSSGPPRVGPGDPGRDAVLGPVAARRCRRSDRGAGRGGAELAVPGGPLGPFDHRPVPGRAAGRRAGRPTSGSVGTWPTSSGWSRDDSSRISSNGSSTHDASLGVSVFRPACDRRRRSPGTCRR